MKMGCNGLNGEGRGITDESFVRSRYVRLLSPVYERLSPLPGAEAAKDNWL